MSVELQSRIREYATWVESGQEPITLEEIMRRFDDTIPLARPIASTGRALRGPWPALVAAAVVVLIFGVFMWVFPTDEPVPPADSVLPPWEQETVYYTTSAVPDGYALQDVRTIGGSGVWYLAEFDDEWLPTDGGFAIHGIDGRPVGVPADPNGYLNATMDAVPGSMEVEVDGRRGIIFETVLEQGEVIAPLTWILSIDDEGGVFEVATVGMSRAASLAVADGVNRRPADDFLALGLGLSWDVSIGTGHNDFVYSPPQRITDLADEVEVALGVDLLYSRLAHAGQEGAVITTQDGEIVDTFGQAIQSSSANHYLHVGQRGIEPVLRAYPNAELSPAQRDENIDRYLESIGGDVLSEDPYVVQAEPGPEPRFDTSQLGEELALVPASSAEVVSELLDGRPLDGGVLATESRPVIVIGTVQVPESDRSVTSLQWFTEAGVPCEGSADGAGFGSACGSVPLSRLGVTGGGYIEDDEGNREGEITYNVPLETSVVQALAGSSSYWQRPIGGYGVFVYGGSVEGPTTIIAYDAEGNEIDRWPA